LTDIDDLLSDRVDYRTFSGTAVKIAHLHFFCKSGNKTAVIPPRRIAAELLFCKILMPGYFSGKAADSSIKTGLFPFFLQKNYLKKCFFRGKLHPKLTVWTDILSPCACLFISDRLPKA